MKYQETVVHANLPCELGSLRRLLQESSLHAVRDLTGSLPLWFWETDETYKISFVDDDLRRVTGFDPNDLLGVNILNPQYGRGVTEGGLDEYQNLLRKRLPVESVSYERIMLTGDRAILLDSALPKFGPYGQFTGYIGITFHLTKAMKMAKENGSLLSSLQSRTVALEEALSQRNQELASSNRLLAEVLEALGEGLLVISHSDLRNPDNEIQFLNPAYRKLMNLGEHEAYPGMPVRQLSDFLSTRGDISQEDVEARSALNEGDTFELNLASNGLSLEVKSLHRPDGGMVIVHSDVTKLRARTALLENARREAETANQAKSDFLATMSHEIRTPMNGIVGVADILGRTRLDDEQAEYVETIRRSATALTELISDILDFSKIEAGRLALTNDPLDLIELAREVQQIMLPIARSKQIALELEFDPDMSSVVLGDKKRLRQVFVNLLGNAVKFTQTGEVRFKLRQSGTNEVTIEVIDTGIGIPEDKIDKIFESFEQVQTGLHREFEGTGLGLAISKNLIENMRGAIDVSSVDGVGTTFTTVLPLPASEVVLAKETAEKKTVLSSYGKWRVLLAEDNKTNQFVAKKMLKLHGIVPVIVSNGKDACARVAEEHFDAVIMDLSMPEMSGLEATRAIRSRERVTGCTPTKIVALTGNAFESDRESCIDAGMDDFLTKPIRMDDLAKCLQRLAALEETQRKRLTA